MKKYSFLLLLCVGLFSCITQQKCYERYPPKSDSVKTTITYIDRVVLDTVKLPEKTVVMHDTLPCPDLEFNKVVSGNGLKQTINIHKGVLKATCKADSLELVISNLIKEKTTLVEANKTQTVEIKTNELTKLQGFWLICGYLFFPLLLIFALFVWFQFKK